MENYRYERVQKICDELSALTTVQSIDLTEWQVKHGFFLTPDAADGSPELWRPFNSLSDIWSGPDDHYWFRTTFTVPKSFDKKPLWFSFVTDTVFWDAVNPQFLIFLNGELLQGLDINHREVFVTGKAKAGDKYVIDLQAYTGRDNDHNHGSTANLHLLGKAIETDPAISECYYNLSVPNRIVSRLDKNDLSRQKLQLALEKAINLLDLREPYSKEFYNSVAACNKFTQTAIYKDLAGNDDVIATCIGHTHIDVAWWWTVEQTKEKVVRSFATVLKLMDEFPDYKFMSSQPQIYKFLKERYPAMYEKIKARVKEGRWEPEGGMWLEADCNVTSGESLVRQFMHGKKFFKDEFGVDNKLLWLPDVFGYSAALPQIMDKCGIKYFMTTKIAWSQFNKLPVDTFWWKGIDGTEIFTHLITTQDADQSEESFYTTYNGKLDPVCLMRSWERYQNKDLNNDVLTSYGWGDGGGGPTREMIETGVRMKKGITGAPKVRMEFAGKYFDELYKRTANNPDLPKWVGELYLEYHRGTYTSMARNKRSNRRCEFLWEDVEFFSAFAALLGIPYDRQEIYDAWELILRNQFHDILPGSSIKEVYEVTKEEYAQLESRAEELIAQKLAAIANAAKAAPNDLVLFNSLSFKRSDVAAFPAESYKDVVAFTDANGNSFPVQKSYDGKLMVSGAELPSKGYSVLSPMQGKMASQEKTVEVKGNTIDTPFYRITLDKTGMFTSVFDKEAERELLKPGEKGNVLRAFEDKPIYYDNWDIEIYYRQKSWIVDDVQSMKWVENGPVRAVLQIERKFLSSYICQDIIFYKASRRIDFATHADWKQHQVLLKAEFALDINATEATYDIQFGNCKRPTHKNTSWDAAKFEVCGHKWADLSDGGYGVALLNDCKYGYAIHDGNMTISLIKSGIVPNPTTDQEEHFFTYSLLPHNSALEQSDVYEQAYMLNLPIYSTVATLPAPSLSVSSILSLDAGNVKAEVVKDAENGDGIIVRLYEDRNMRKKVTAKWFKPISAICECNLLEEDGNAVDFADNCFTFTIKPYEIKTFRIK